MKILYNGLSNTTVSPKIPIQAFVKTKIEGLFAKVLITRQYLY